MWTLDSPGRSVDIVQLHDAQIKNYYVVLRCKCKAIPVQASIRPQGL